MYRIAKTELQQELQRLLAYAQSARPSRVRLAAALQDLSVRVAAFYDNTPFKQREQAMSKQLRAAYLEDLWKAINEHTTNDSAFSLDWIGSHNGWQLKVGLHPLRGAAKYTDLEPSDPVFDAARIGIWARKMAVAA